MGIGILVVIHFDGSRLAKLRPHLSKLFRNGSKMSENGFLH